MDREGISQELEVIIGDYLKARGLDLIELIYRYEGNNLVLRILTDKPQGGITLEECASINKEISAILDEKDILQRSYNLEVSSPGLDRPLKTKSDFSRCLSKEVRIFLNEPVKEKVEWQGIISRVEDEIVYIDTEGAVIQIPLSKVRKVKQVINNI